jgi:hypothetical protein
VASLRRLVNLLITVLYPVAFPISKILDVIFGEQESGDMSRDELQALMILQSSGHEAEFRQSIRQTSRCRCCAAHHASRLFVTYLYSSSERPESLKLSKDEVHSFHYIHLFAQCGAKHFFIMYFLCIG